jgi:hypothetical protein
VMRGTLRMWGAWFGRPYDNVHGIVAAEASGEVLTLRFDEGETLVIERPDRSEIGKDRFRIGDADRITWRWRDYGQPRLPETLHERIQVRPTHVRDDEPAVELL